MIPLTTNDPLYKIDAPTSTDQPVIVHGFQARDERRVGFILII